MKSKFTVAALGSAAAAGMFWIFGRIMAELRGVCGVLCEPRVSLVLGLVVGVVAAALYQPYPPPSDGD